MDSSTQPPAKTLRPLGGGLLGEPGDQPGLADPRLAAHEDGGGGLFSGLVEDLPELLQLGLPSDEDGASGPTHHVVQHVTPTR
ncbi:hypothetical protein HerbRD11066_75950 [Herbidospora sp. RD11066]